MIVKLFVALFATCFAVTDTANAVSVIGVQPSSVNLVMGPIGVTDVAVSFAFTKSSSDFSYQVYGSTSADCTSSDPPAWMDFQQTGDFVPANAQFFEHYDVRIAFYGFSLGYSDTAYFCIVPDFGTRVAIPFTLTISADVVFQDGFEGNP